MVDITLAKSNLDEAQSYANWYSTCAKVKVGSVIHTLEGRYVFGYNHGVNNCVKNGCRRIAIYGNASKEHRLPSDCDAIHSEVDAICKAAKKGLNLNGATIYVTRYPCEACARAIAESGIIKVIYGRKEKISDYTRKILKSVPDMEICHIDSWEREDNNE